MIRLSTEYFRFMEISNLYIHKHWEFHGFSSTLTLRGSEGYGKSLCFFLIFPYYKNSHFPYFGSCMDCALSKIFEKPITLECLCFPNTFPVLWEFTFSMFWELYGFQLHPKYLRNPQIWNVCVFPYFTRTMEIHFSHMLGTA